MQQEIQEYDVVVVGAGPVGENAADYAIRGTERTCALVEAELFGGECSYWACMPSKALLRPLDVAAAANHLDGVARPVEISPKELLARRDSWAAHWNDDGQRRWVQQAGITPVRGRARLVGAKTLEVRDSSGKTTRLRAREAVVLATGSVPELPENLREIRPWDNRDATAVQEIPGRLAIVGGGVVAVESARWMSALGSRVTLLVRGERLLGAAEPFAGDYVLDSLRAAGVEVRFGTSVTGAERPGSAADHRVGHLHGEPVMLRLSGPGSTDHEFFDEVLVATGRRPAVDGLGLEALGLDPKELRGHVHPGQVVRGTVSPLPEWLYLVGDASGEAPLTHWGKYRARQVGLAISAASRGEDGAEAFSTGEGEAPVPQVVFTDPQVCWVGPTAARAQASGHDVVVHDVPFSSAAGSVLLRDDVTGRARLVADAATNVLLGATFVGPEAQELLHSATVAVTGRMTLESLRHAVPSYPTASELWLHLLDAAPERPEDS